MNNFLFEAVCSWSSESVRKPSEKGVRKPSKEAFGKGNTSPCLDRSVKMNPIALLTYYSSGSYWPNPFANIRSERGECKFFAHFPADPTRHKPPETDLTCYAEKPCTM